MFHQKELISGECYHTNHERNGFEKQKATHIKYQRKVKIKGSKYPTVFHIQEEMVALARAVSIELWGGSQTAMGQKENEKQEEENTQNTLSSKAGLGERGCALVAKSKSYGLLRVLVRGDKS